MKSGGTGQAIDMASRKNIPVINLANPNWKTKLDSVLNGTFKPQGEQLSLFPELSQEENNNITEEEKATILWQKKFCKE